MTIDRENSAKQAPSKEVAASSTSWPTLVWRGLRRRCPRCSQKGISRHPAHVSDICPHCGLDIERHPGSFIGAIGLNTVVSFAILLAIIIVGFIVTKGKGSIVGVLIPALVVAVVFPILFYARSRLAWVGAELAMVPDGQDPPRASNVPPGFGQPRPANSDD